MANEHKDELKVWSNKVSANLNSRRLKEEETSSAVKLSQFLISPNSSEVHSTNMQTVKVFKGGMRRLEIQRESFKENLEEFGR